jgi:hypothetical protein
MDIPLSLTERLAAFPRRLHEKPSCVLTRQWYENEHGKTVTRYVGADGFLYESDEDDGWFAFGKDEKPARIDVS